MTNNDTLVATFGMNYRDRPMDAGFYLVTLETPDGESHRRDGDYRTCTEFAQRKATEHGVGLSFRNGNMGEQ